MPIYEYSCQSCGKTIDVLQKISDPTPEACTACGAAGSLSRVVSRSSFVLKGGGWYADLYGSTKKDGGSSSSSSSSSSSASTSTSSTSGGGDSSSSASSSTAAAAPAATSSTPKT
ncbi:zinc ribbon domain-containing protein [Corallococcus sp. H22C18031201]|uniref:FmdB family zinc ribbon protein n=1 Tax=Citreicoccus inhibens TaxID=2849499 RepID=UPI000E71A60A|nr:zinc ribbon domain-containing protein [Citreicoccus inhibens]MBU8894817.1 zinc ribbon domain-containing protein [Citreicoccus inhibens]RJS17663.1 zinc ribbon domain-containing protein [Corallococcus sp. H22C18031201]